MNSRFYVMIFFNLAISALMIVINILVLPIRIITKKRWKLYNNIVFFVIIIKSKGVVHWNIVEYY